MKRLNFFYYLIFLVIAVVLFAWIWMRFMSIVNEQQRVIDSLLQIKACSCNCKPKVVSPAPKPVYRPKPKPAPVVSPPIQSAPNGPIPGVPEPTPRPTPSYDIPSYTPPPVQTVVPIRSAPNGPTPGVPEPAPKSTPSYDPYPSTYIQPAPSGATNYNSAGN